MNFSTRKEAKKRMLLLLLLGFFLQNQGLFAQTNNIADGGEIGFNQIICQGETPNLVTNLVFPTGGSGNIEYMWMKKEGPSSPWVIIPNTDSPEYQPGALFTTTYYQRCSRREGNTSYTGETEILTITVKPRPLAIINSPLTSLVQDTPNTFEAQFAGTNALYEWDFGDNAVPSTATARIVPNVIFSSVGLQIITLKVTSDNGCVTEQTFNYSIAALLPVELVYFKGNATRDGINLTWKTASEINNRGFEIWRKGATKDWETVGFVEGEGFSSEEVHYHFADAQPLAGINYYQLKQIDFDGKTSLSDIISFQQNGMPTIAFFPNPAQDKVVLNFGESLGTYDTGEIQIFSVTTGQLVSKQPLEIDESTLEFFINDWSNGQYLIRFIANNQTIFQQQFQKI